MGQVNNAKNNYNKTIINTYIFAKYIVVTLKID